MNPSSLVLTFVHQLLRGAGKLDTLAQRLLCMIKKKCSQSFGEKNGRPHVQVDVFHLLLQTRRIRQRWLTFPSGRKCWGWRGEVVFSKGTFGVPTPPLLTVYPDIQGEWELCSTQRSYCVISSGSIKRKARLILGARSLPKVGKWKVDEEDQLFLEKWESPLMVWGRIICRSEVLPACFTPHHPPVCHDFWSSKFSPWGGHRHCLQASDEIGSF